MENETSGARVLLAEDDEHAALLLAEKLGENGFSVTRARDGKEAVLLVNSRDFDLALLDIMMPGKDGLQVAELIRSHHRTLPVVFITARRFAEDRIAGFRAGCDDYIVKPFNTEELLLRLEVVLRRNHPGGLSEGVVKISGVTFDSAQHLIRTQAKEISLTPKESAILQVFLHHFNRTLPRNFILERAWGTSNVYTSKGLDVYIHRLRKLLKEAGPFEISNSHGLGYRFSLNPEEETGENKKS